MSDAIRDAALRAVRDGLAVVLIRPGQKEPLCPLSAAEGKRADDVVRAEARSAGDARWGLRKHACGLHCALTDEAALISALDRLAKNDVIPNLAIETGRSRVVVVDVDTAGEKNAFLTAWTEATGEHMTSEPPTVTSPGAKGADGTWKHKDGGHYWFRVPKGDDLPTGGPGVIKAPGGGSLLWRNKYVLIPPSERSEGVYRWTGEIRQLPPWLREFIEKEAAVSADRTPSGEIRNGDPIDDWAAGVPWAEILAPDGWTDTGKADNCGCPIWTAPGPHDSPKSATAHEGGCLQYDTSGGQGPIHIWTDNVPDCAAEAVAAKGRTFSKLTYVAFRDHGGDMDAARAGEGIMNEDAEGPTRGPSGEFLPGVSSGAVEVAVPARQEWMTDEDYALLRDPATVKEWRKDLHRRQIRESVDRYQAYERHTPGLSVSDALDALLNGAVTDVPTVGTIEGHARGWGLFYPGFANGIFGDGSTAKSVILAETQARELNGGGIVVHFEYDNNPVTSIIQRLLNAGADLDAIRYRFHVIYTLGERDKLTSDVIRAVKLVTLDALNPACAAFGVDPYHPSGPDTVIRECLQPFTLHGACGVFIDHVGHENKDRQTGSIRKSQAVQGALYEAVKVTALKPGKNGVTKLINRKDNRGALGDTEGTAVAVVEMTSMVAAGDPAGKVVTTFTLHDPAVGYLESAPTGVGAIIAILDREEIDTAWGRPRVRDLLNERGITLPGNNNDLQSAIWKRRTDRH
ncbi:bifunctional DNA primase/polymerase [Streptomyces sp. NPDC051554]|uniref:bifunctional DNA primase/polymerase n=1 Tax=Streptomyces sp. NPDC051554 TaxID=3365656 RepID=UPI0037B3DF72